LIQPKWHEPLHLARRVSVGSLVDGVEREHSGSIGVWWAYGAGLAIIMAWSGVLWGVRHAWRRLA
jgi:hypothetical protein